MNVIITCSVPELDLQAGLMYDLDANVAAKLIEEEKAIPADEPKSTKPKKGSDK